MKIGLGLGLVSTPLPLALEVVLGEQRHVVGREGGRGQGGGLLHVLVLDHLHQAAHRQPVVGVPGVRARARVRVRGRR